MADDDTKARIESEPDPGSPTERFLHNIVENIPAMVFVKDAEELRFQLFNRAGEELLGYPREEMLGKNDYDFFPPEQADFFTTNDREVLESGELRDIPEEPIETRHGERILHTKKIPILDADGEPTHLLGISIDITEQKERERELRESQRQLERAIEDAQSANRAKTELLDRLRQANEELEAFTYSVAHDLRAPLRAIDGFSEALVEQLGDELSEEAERNLGFVRDGARQMAQLIDDLLELSRVSRSDLRTEDVNLSALARRSIERLRRGASDREVDVVIEEDVIARGDPQLLSIVLDNLLANAWKFTSGQAAATIEFRAEDHDGERVFVVEDDGAGFDPRFADKLFGVFQRLHAPDEFEGTGIGLATVDRIVGRHGGEAWGTGEVGGGATIYFTLGESDSSPDSEAER